MKPFLKRVRLLPLVILAGMALLTVKGVGLVHDAQAQGSTQDGGDAAGASVLAQDSQPLPKDIADDGAGASPAEADVLSSLAERRKELDARGRDLDMRANLLAATEARVDAKIAALKQLQTQIAGLLAQRDAAQEKQVTALVKTYSAMKPKDAARIFNSLSDDVLIPVAQEMKSDALAPIMAAMTPEAAEKLTEKLASKLQLPDTASLAMAAPQAAPAQAATPATTSAAAAPAQAAMPAAPAPQQTAAPAPNHG